MFLVNFFQKKDRREPILPESNTCLICFNELNKETTARPLPCKHGFCKDCLTSYLKTKIDNNEVLKINCPQVKCREAYSQKIIRDLVEPETYKLYQERLVKKVMNRDPNFKFCPQPGCTKQLKLSTSLPYTKCKCNTLVCNICLQPWHEGKTCLEAMDIEFEQYAKKNSIRFCVMCKSQVDKVHGCNHIICPVCDYEFCWNCGREDHAKKMTKCPGYWSPIPPNDPVMNKENFFKITVPLFAMGGFLVLLDIILSLTEFVSWYIILPALSASIYYGKYFIAVPSAILFFLRVLGMAVYSIGFDNICFIALIATFLITMGKIIWDYYSQQKRWMKGPSFFKYTSKQRPIYPVARAARQYA